MTEKPILFSGSMVRAIFAGTKTQTRRLLKGSTEFRGPYNPAYLEMHRRSEGWAKICPYGCPGDQLWVRETWAAPPGSDFPSDLAYRAALSPAQEAEERAVRRLVRRAENPWRPSIHMPRWASRLSLEVLSVRVERLQEISEADARAEGVQAAPFCKAGRANGLEHVEAFEDLWDSINGKRAAWKSNPWVWRVEFKRAEVL